MIIGLIKRVLIIICQVAIDCRVCYLKLIPLADEILELLNRKKQGY
jgi:hypothetical protein